MTSYDLCGYQTRLVSYSHDNLCTYVYVVDKRLSMMMQILTYVFTTIAIRKVIALTL